MITFALRLAVSGGRQAVARLLTITAATAVGVGLLLSTLAAVNAVGAANDRMLWSNSGAKSRTETANVDPLWWRDHGPEFYDGKRLLYIEVAATGPTSPVPPGMAKLPATGEYYASPALAKLIRETPADHLADRFPGRLVGEIGKAALASPDSLVLVEGQDRTALAARPGARPITTVADRLPDCQADCPGGGVRGDAMTLILSVVAGALLFPVVIFIGTATRLSAATREQRYAAMRLVGATPRQITAIAAVESTLAAVAGTVLGFVVFLLLRPLVATVPFTGERFFTEDLTLTAVQCAAVLLGVPLAAAVAARLALRRVTVSPLGVSRRATPKPPSVWRVAPLLAGLAELAWFVGRRPQTTNGQTAAYLTGFLVVMFGLVVAGPWLTMAVARLVAARTSRPATLIAVRRLADDPKAGFRSVAGLILALFVTTATVAIIGTIDLNRGELSGDPQTRVAVEHGVMAGEPPMTDALPERVLADLRAVPGFRGIAVAHANPDGLAHDPDAPPDWPEASLVSCADLAQTPAVGHCAPGAAVAAVEPFGFLSLTSQAAKEWPTAPITAEAVDRLPVVSLYVTTDGTTAAKERVRTLLSRAFPDQHARMVQDWGSAQQKELAGWRQLADVVLLTTLPIAGCSLAVSVVAGLSDRRRPFAMLRLTGAPLRMLRVVIGLESALPLLVVSAIAIGTGLGAAAMFLKSQMDYDLVSPGAVFFGLVLLGLASSLGIIASTLPLLKRITGPEAARNG
ncbi:FtsX-like permease family protein [Streptomyces sp. NRRL S-495]|uniref:FtsX-like permease family protein n=1 Tax=Streptomyces sp. NRRL S-495 TaxID=1609133 RepID=UPI0005F95BBE|nr:FtsX-like permease family protein [Streptomyces sp. NRRL S-495]KJY32294.1 ABC transporter permease [Streptomyces sp. NRRL S-495]